MVVRETKLAVVYVQCLKIRQPQWSTAHAAGQRALGVHQHAAADDVHNCTAINQPLVSMTPRCTFHRCRCRCLAWNPPRSNLRLCQGVAKMKEKLEAEAKPGTRVVSVGVSECHEQ